MRFLRSALVSCLVLLAGVLAKSSSGDKVLVLLDPALDRENYSIFFNGLESMSRRTICSLLFIHAHCQNEGTT